jgi:hypothetical protein
MKIFSRNQGSFTLPMRFPTGLEDEGDNYGWFGFESLRVADILREIEDLKTSP